MKTALLLLLLGGFLCGLHGAEGQDTDLLSMITKLQTEVQALKTQEQTHQSEVQSLKNQIQDLETKDQSHQSEVQSLKNQIQDLETKDQSHQSKVQSLKNQIQDLETKDQSHQSEVQVIKTQMLTLEKNQFELQTSPRVAFYAGWSMRAGSLSLGQPIKYDHVVTNVGGAYSADTGKFTAPLKGLYVFTFVMTTAGEARGALMKNTEHLTLADEQTISEKYDSSSGGAVVTLEVGDTVYVQQLQYRSSWGFHPLFNTFRGFLLAPL